MKGEKVVSYFSPEMKGNEGKMNTEWLQKWIDRRTKTPSKTDPAVSEYLRAHEEAALPVMDSIPQESEIDYSEGNKLVNIMQEKIYEIKNKIKPENGLKLDIKETTDGKCRIDIWYNTEDNSWYTYSMAADYLTIDPKDFGKRDFHWKNVAFRTHTNFFGQGNHYLPLLEQNYDITLRKNGELTIKKSEK